MWSKKLIAWSRVHSSSTLGSMSKACPRRTALRLVDQSRTMAGPSAEKKISIRNKVASELRDSSPGAERPRISPRRRVAGRRRKLPPGAAECEKRWTVSYVKPCEEKPFEEVPWLCHCHIRTTVLRIRSGSMQYSIHPRSIPLWSRSSVYLLVWHRH